MLTPNRFLLTLNGVLTAMVAQCAGCDEYAPWGALIVGMFGGVAFIVIHTAMLKCRLDDPLDAVAVHGGGGKLPTIYMLGTNKPCKSFHC